MSLDRNVTKFLWGHLEMEKMVGLQSPSIYETSAFFQPMKGAFSN